MEANTGRTQHLEQPVSEIRQPEPGNAQHAVESRSDGLGLGIMHAELDRADHVEVIEQDDRSALPNMQTGAHESTNHSTSQSGAPDSLRNATQLPNASVQGQNAKLSAQSTLTSTEAVTHSKTMSEESLKVSRPTTEKFVPGYSDLPDIEEPSLETVSWLKRILNFVRAQWFLITMAVLIIIASQKQVSQRHEKQKNYLVAYIATSVIFFLTGVTLKTKVLISQYARWKIHLWVQVQCFLIVSLLMFALVTVAATKQNFMDPGLLCGMVLTGTVATTISSNVVMTGQAHGNTALTVTQSTLGNIIGVFLTPALFKAYTSTGAWYTKVLPHEPGGSAALYSRVFKQLGLSVFIPLFVGQVAHNTIPEKFIKLVCTTWKVSKLGSVALLVIIWSTYDSAFSSGALRSVPGHNIAFVVLMSIIMFFIFLVISFVFSKKWLDRPDTVACCYCIPAKSPAIGIPLSTVLFTGLSPMLQAKLQLPLVLYQGLQILAGTILTGPFANWVDRADRVTRGRGRYRNPV